MVYYLLRLIILKRIISSAFSDKRLLTELNDARSPDKGYLLYKVTERRQWMKRVILSSNMINGILI